MPTQVACRPPGTTAGRQGRRHRTLSLRSAQRPFLWSCATAAARLMSVGAPAFIQAFTRISHLEQDSYKGNKLREARLSNVTLLDVLGKETLLEIDVFHENVLKFQIYLLFD